VEPTLDRVPRPLRLRVAGGLYHVGAGGNRRQPVFSCETDYRRFLALLGAVIESFGWRCHTYCLMPNHFHLILETPEPNISEGMQRLNGTYAQWFNLRYGYDGHLFQGRFFSELIESTYHLLELARYVVLNPVRAGLCKDAGGWPWSSYRAFVGEAKRLAFLTVEWLLEQFGKEPERAREHFRRFVLDAPPKARPP
jgi:REP element-mobilizing transposase RayT